MNTLTQEKVNEIFEEIKSDWDSMVFNSGMDPQSLIFIGAVPVIRFLAEYQVARELVEGEGLVMPELVPGLSVRVEI